MPKKPQPTNQQQEPPKQQQQQNPKQNNPPKKPKQNQNKKTTPQTNKKTNTREKKSNVWLNFLFMGSGPPKKHDSCFCEEMIMYRAMAVTGFWKVCHAVIPNILIACVTY